MANKIKHNVLVGNRIFQVEIKGQEIKGQLEVDHEGGSVETQLKVDMDSLIREQRKVAYRLIIETKRFDIDVFNYVLNVSGLKAAKVAKMLECTPSYISQIRRGKRSADTGAFWKLFRLVMLTVLSDKGSRDHDKIIEETDAA